MADKDPIEKRRREGLGRIRKTVLERHRAGVPPIPPRPKKGVPHKAPKVPPGKEDGATATPVEVVEPEDEQA